ncbi:site-specific integrase [Pseudomonas brenneri]|nr:site-specific integrase [Pseudomonas gessardii]NNA91475.1 site-specific integrase [Pseudomonas gessardii]WJM92271.1 site-specific integrase [Pseudomonas brenneri]
MGRDGRGVRAVSESSIEITFMFRGVRCRERISLKPTATNLKKAEQHKAAIEHSIAIGTFDYATTFPRSKLAGKFSSSVGQMKLERYLTTWLEKKQPQLKSSTFAGYKKIIQGRLIPLFGERTLGELSRRMIREQLETLETGNKRLANIQSCLRSALNDAIDDELLETNPLAGWTFSRKRALKRVDDVDPFDAEEQAAILSMLDGPAHNMYKFAFWTGLRPSEWIALEWDDIDWVKRIVRVVRAQTQDADEPEITKTDSSERRVKLLGPALQALIAQKSYTFHTGNHIFLDPRYETPFSGDQAIRKSFWIPALKKAGVRYRRPYQTRHTFASMMLSAGEHPMWVAKQMGHADWMMIARTYGRWMPSADENAGAKAELVFARDTQRQESDQTHNDSFMPSSALEAPELEE